MQCFALIPGVSRSGATISAGLLRGIDRVTATRLSFLLGIPALFAAGLLELKKALSTHGSLGPTLLATVVSFVVAYVSIAWLLRFVQPPLDRAVRALPGGRRAACVIGAARRPASCPPPAERALRASPSV